MHVVQLLYPFFLTPHIEVIEACLPERSALLIVKQLALSRIMARSFGQQARAVRCFSTCMTVETLPISGSVSKR